MGCIPHCSERTCVSVSNASARRDGSRVGVSENNFPVVRAGAVGLVCIRQTTSNGVDNAMSHGASWGSWNFHNPKPTPLPPTRSPRRRPNPSRSSRSCLAVAVSRHRSHPRRRSARQVPAASAGPTATTRSSRVTSELLDNHSLNHRSRASIGYDRDVTIPNWIAVVVGGVGVTAAVVVKYWDKVRGGLMWLARRLFPTERQTEMSQIVFALARIDAEGLLNIKLSEGTMTQKERTEAEDRLLWLDDERNRLVRVLTELKFPGIIPGRSWSRPPPKRRVPGKWDRP